MEDTITWFAISQNEPPLRIGDNKSSRKYLIMSTPIVNYGLRPTNYNYISQTNIGDAILFLYWIKLDLVSDSATVIWKVKRK